MVDNGASADLEEIRFACVFNGGVSLAVWMGGVAHEINELTGTGAAYAPLLRLLRVRARADVISGTSAGGINGAALALAQVNEHADLADLREVWGDQGRLETLLQVPFQDHPTSLLRGEEVFLPELTRALHRLATPWRARDVRERPIDLTITATLLDGVTLQHTDSLGRPLTQKRHDVHFRFTRRDGAGDDFAGAPAPRGSGPVDGAAPDESGPGHPAGPREDVVAALALAARTSAGFPFAFEPTLIPVDADEPVPDRPDMAPYASWRGNVLPGRAKGPDRSRYAVDGGLLNNTPTQHALSAIEQMPADLVVDRVMLLVVPLPAVEVAEAGPAEEPTVAAMARGLGASLTSTGSRTFIEEVEHHNRQATSLRGTRRDVLATAGDADRLTATARDLYAHYRRARLRRDIRDLAAQTRQPRGYPYERVRACLEACHEQLDAAPDTTTLPGRFDELAAPSAAWPWGAKPLLDMGAAALEYLGVLHDALPVEDRGTVREARGEVHAAMVQVRAVRAALDRVWGTDPALAVAVPDLHYWHARLATDAWFQRGAAAALDVVRSALPRLEVDPGRRAEDTPARLDADIDPDRVLALTAGRLGRLGSGAGTATDGVPPGAGTATDDVPIDAGTATGDVPIDAGTTAEKVPTGAGGGLAGALLGAAADRLVAAVVVAGRLERLQQLARAADGLDPAWLPLLDAAGDAAPDRARARTRQVLAALHVVAWTVGEELPTENTNPLRYTQVSAATPNHFASYSRTVDEKLGGASLARFSGFLKRSWRINDWAWGRFDGASALFRVLLTPARVRTLAEATGAGTDPVGVVDLLLATTWGAEAARALRDDTAQKRTGALTRLAALREAAVEEAARALGGTDRHPEPERPDAPEMASLAALLAYGRHVVIVHEELPEVVRAVRHDAADGANPRSHGHVFVAQHETLLRRLEETRTAPGTPDWLTTGVAALHAFDHAGIGREPLDEEGASDQIIRTAVTAMAVAATVAAGKNSGLGVVAPVTRSVKGAVKVPYWVTLGLTSGGLLARSLGLLALAAGGVLFVLALLGLLDGGLAGVAGPLGAGVFLTVLAYAALRTRSHLHGVVLAIVGALLVYTGVAAARGGWEPSLATGGAVGAVVLVTGLALLGSLREPLSSPKVMVEDATVWVVERLLRHRLTERGAGPVRTAGVLLVVAAVAVLVVVLVAQGAARLDRLFGWPVPAERDRWALGLAAAAVAGLAAWAVLAGARGLRRWEHVAGEWRLERMSGAAGVTAGWSVVYGTAALAGCGAVLTWWPEGRLLPATWMVGGLALAAVVFLAVVPTWVLARERRRVAARVRAALASVVRARQQLAAGEPTTDPRDRAERVARWLEANRWAYSSVVRRVGRGAEQRLELRPRALRGHADAGPEGVTG